MFFVAPQKNTENFKVLFARLAAEGAGRPVDEHGFADGPWTPETLADAISSIDANQDGIELRAVQVWFQDNDNGISDANIRWLARIFGCDDPEVTSQWQAELRAAKVRLTKERRERRNSGVPSKGPRSEPVVVWSQTDVQETTQAAILRQERVDDPSGADPATPFSNDDIVGSQFSMARTTEAMFNSESSLTLPLVVFTGACALALIAFTLNIHSVMHTSGNGQARQVGFLWAPNWTIVFFVVLPLFLAILIELLNCWREDWRPRLLSLTLPNEQIGAWDRGVAKASYSFWVTFGVTVVVASGYNWLATHLIPLLEGDPGSWPIDWGRIAIVKPEQISVSSAIAFSGLVFLFNGFTAYLFFTGHIFLNLMKSDFSMIMKSVDPNNAGASVVSIEHIGFRLMTGIFRCTALGIVITIMMKLQSGYLQSGATNILEWLWADLRQVFGVAPDIEAEAKEQSAAPGVIYSFLCVLAIVGTFISAQLRIRRELNRVTRIKNVDCWNPWMSMNICMTLLVTSYFLVGLVPGFTILVLLSLLATVYLVGKSAEQETEAVAKGMS